LEKVCQSLRKATPIAIRQWLTIIDQYELNASILQYKIKNILKKADSKPYYDFVLPDTSYIPSFIPLDTSVVKEISFTAFMFLPQVMPRLKIVCSLSEHPVNNNNELFKEETDKQTEEVPEQKFKTADDIHKEAQYKQSLVLADTPKKELKIEYDISIVSQTINPEISGETKAKEENIKKELISIPKYDKKEIDNKDLELLNKEKEEFDKYQNLYNILTVIKEQEVDKIDNNLKKFDSLFSSGILIEIYENREKIKPLLEPSIRLIRITLKENFSGGCKLDRLVILRKQIEQKKNKIINLVNSIKKQIETLKNIRIKSIKLWNNILKNYKNIYKNIKLLSYSDINQIKNIRYELKGLSFLIKNDKCFNNDLLKKLENIDYILQKYCNI